MTNVDVVLDHFLWKKKIKNPKNYIKKKLNKLNKISFFKKKSKNHTIYLTNNKNMKALNKKFRNRNKPTDVLSFPFNKKQKKLKENYLGDIIISFNYMNKPKNLDNYEFKIKTIKIFIHGFLHLLGHDHQKSKEYKQMLNEEKKIFKSIKKLPL